MSQHWERNSIIGKFDSFDQGNEVVFLAKNYLAPEVGHKICSKLSHGLEAWTQFGFPQLCVDHCRSNSRISP